MVRWIDDERFELDGTVFLTTGDKDFNDTQLLAPFFEAESTLNQFVVWKTRTIIDRYAELIRRTKAKRIFELGILKGGSTAFLALAAHPDKLVAVDVASDEVAVLRRFLERERLTGRIKTYYGVDQGDRRRLERIVQDEFAAEPLDLVVDDASHQLDLTRASFNQLFPRLRPGGTYVIEDWSWAHALHAIDVHHLGPPLTNLIFEIIVSCASVRDVIASVELDWGVVYVTRGHRSVDTTFDVAQPFVAAREKGTAEL